MDAISRNAIDNRHGIALSGQPHRKAIDRAQSGGSLPALELPTDRPRPAVPTFRSARQPLALTPILTQALQALSEREGVSLFVLLSAAFQTLLYRYSHQEEIVVGTGAACACGCGPFANTRVLRTEFSEGLSFRALLGRVQQAVLEADAHPPFQVMVVFQEAPTPARALPGRTRLPPNGDSGAAPCELLLDLSQTSEGLCGWLEYSADLFDAATIARMAGHFRTLLEGIVADPEQPLWKLPLLTPAERHQILVEWNRTQADSPQEDGIHQFFEQQVERTPDAVAVVCGEEQWTYAQLNGRANQLARYLQRLGVGPEVLVGICAERSLEMVVGLLGILKAGGAYVPLDPTYPKERLAFMLEDTKAHVLLTQEKLHSELPTHTARVVLLDTDWEAIAQESEANLSSQGTAKNLAYVIYTSGSTGRPKGVAIEHRNTSALLNWARKVFRPEDLAGVLASTSICFDLSVFELFVPLSWGGKVILAENALQLPDLPAARDVTLINTVPSAIAALLQIQGVPASVRIVNLAGEPLQTRLVQQLYEQRTIEKVFDLYGPSEGTTYSTFSLRRTNGPATIGRPIDNTQIYLLDAHLQPVPIGVPGELYIGGAGLARGYLNRPELTAERFIPNPFRDETGPVSPSRLYKTGDLARYLPDGNIEFLGRIDHQVKIRGYRIELGEVEAALGQHPAIRQAVVLGREDQPGHKRLVAYVVPHRAPAPGSQELRGFLTATLPEYMVPSAFVTLNALPLTPSGKVDRKALPRPEPDRAGQDRGLTAPRDSFELQLTQIWEQVLGTRPIGVTESFFDLGGHSLLAVRVFLEIEKWWGKKLPLATLFEAPTVEQLARVLRQESASALWSSLVAIQPGGSRPPFFCVHGLGGNVLSYRDLAWHLGPDQPFYGLQAQGLDGKKAGPITVEEMASHYIREILTLQPAGPYFLGGWSFGGTVAFEMARQWHERGQKVALLALFDTSGPTAARPLLEKGRCHLEILRGLNGQERLRYVWSRVPLRVTSLKKGIEERIWWLARSSCVRLGLPLPPILANVERVNRRADRDYVPQVYPGRMTLFRAMEQLPEWEHDPQLGWEDLATGGLVIHDVPGNHLTLIQEPNVRALAEQLNACLEKAQDHGPPASSSNAVASASQGSSRPASPPGGPAALEVNPVNVTSGSTPDSFSS
jgi:amino acid adenylation domain-containing protein